MKETKKVLQTPPRRTLEEKIARSKDDEVIFQMPLPESPSLKEQALAILDDCSDRLDGAHENIIRLALEALPND